MSYNDYKIMKHFAFIIDKFGNEILIDKDDIERCKKIKWYVSPSGYVGGTIMNGEKYYGYDNCISLHRFIKKAHKGENVVVDHINHNKLDNRKFQLRKCTQIENNMNKKSYIESNYYYKKRQKENREIAIKLMMKEIETPYLTSKQICSILKIDRSDLTKLINLGLPHLKILKSYRFKFNEVVEYLKNKEA